MTRGASDMTRRVLLDRLRARLGLSAREAGDILDGFLEVLAGQLAEGGVASFRGLGRFETRMSPPRQGRDPATGRPVSIPARRRPVFTLSPDLRAFLREGEACADPAESPADSREPRAY